MMMMDENDGLSSTSVDSLRARASLPRRAPADDRQEILEISEIEGEFNEDDIQGFLDQGVGQDDGAHQQQCVYQCCNQLSGPTMRVGECQHRMHQICLNAHICRKASAATCPICGDAYLKNLYPMFHQVVTAQIQAKAQQSRGGGHMMGAPTFRVPQNSMQYEKEQRELHMMERPPNEPQVPNENVSVVPHNIERRGLGLCRR